MHSINSSSVDVCKAEELLVCHFFPSMPKTSLPGGHAASSAEYTQ